MPVIAIAAAVLFAIAKARTAQVAAEKSAAARGSAAAALAANAQTDDVSEGALVELDRAQTQDAKQAATYQTAVRTELEEVGGAAAQAVTDAQEAVETAIQEPTADQNRAGPAAARRRGQSGHRKSKMTPELIDKAKRMYDSRRFTIAEIAQSCAVSPTTIYRHIRTSRV
jgi:hypothetical protein